MKLSLEYVVRKPLVDVEKPPVLILLHGYGSHEEDLFSFAPELPEEFLIISARAPLSLGMGGYAWYSLHFDDTDGKFSDIPEALHARDLIAKFIDEVKSNFEIDHEKVFLLGFSQGTILSYAVALTYPDKVQYVLALSGYINEELIPTDVSNHQYEQLDFYISHGSVDQVLPVDWARKAPPLLTKLNIKHVYSEYPVGHGVAPQNFYSLKLWIEERLGKSSN